MTDEGAGLTKTPLLAGDVATEVPDMIETESVGWSVLGVVNNVMGAGVLSIASTLVDCGMIFGLFLLGALAAIQVVGARMVLRVIEMTDSVGVDEAATTLFGKVGGVILSITVIADVSFIMLAYIIIATNSAMAWTGSFIPYEEHRILLRGAVVVIVSAALIGLSMPRTLSFLSRASIWTATALLVFIATMLSMVFAGPIQPVALERIGGNVTSVVGIYALAFCLPLVIGPVVRNTRGGLRGQVKAIVIAVVLCYIATALPAICGYLFFGDSVRGDVLDGFDCIIDALPRAKLVMATICQFGFFGIIVLSYPAVHPAVSCSWSKLIYKQNNFFELSGWPRVIILFVTNAWIVIIAIFLPEMRPAFEVAGAFGGSLGNISFPALLWLKASQDKWTTPGNIGAIALAIFGVICSGMGTYYAVLDAIAAFRGEGSDMCELYPVIDRRSGMNRRFAAVWQNRQRMATVSCSGKGRKDVYALHGSVS
jgi:amino acid permease